MLIYINAHIRGRGQLHLVWSTPVFDFILSYCFLRTQIYVSFVELYNEKTYDLLAVESEKGSKSKKAKKKKMDHVKKALKISENSDNDFYVNGATEIQVI